MGEKELKIFEYLLIGSFPDPTLITGVKKDIKRFRRPFIVEWTLPIEISSCPAYTKDKLCEIYKKRPFTCRMFPRTHTGEIHPFCPMGESVCTVKRWKEPIFTRRLAKLDAFLMNMLFLKKDGERLLAELLYEENPFRGPALYNSYLILVLILAKVDVKTALLNQRIAIKRLKSQGLEDVNFYIPDSDNIMPAKLSGIEINLDYLLFRIEREQLLEKLTTIIREIL